MIDFYINSGVYIQVLIATLMTFLITTLGSALVFFFKKVNGTVLDAMLGLSAGVMIAASFFSLLNPAIDDASGLGMNAPIIVTIGFLIGSVILIISDNIW